MKFKDLFYDVYTDGINEFKVPIWRKYRAEASAWVFVMRIRTGVWIAKLIIGPKYTYIAHRCPGCQSTVPMFQKDEPKERMP